MNVINPATITSMTQPRHAIERDHLPKYINFFPQSIVEELVIVELGGMLDRHETASPHPINEGKKRSAERMLVLWTLDV